MTAVRPLIALVLALGALLLGSPAVEATAVIFSGTLRDRDGTAVPNQLVRLLGVTEHSATTAADGSFSLSVAPGTYTIGVRRSGSGGAAKIPNNFDLFGPSINLAGDTVRDLTLRNVFLDVTVLDPNGMAVPNTSVNVPCASTSFELLPAGNTSGGVCGWGTTDSLGVARITLFPASSVSVTATPPPASGLPQMTVLGVSVLGDTTLVIPDADRDSVTDGVDNCPLTSNPLQQNNVHPGTPAGDHCEDPEPDGVYDISDNCPDVANPGQENADGDPRGDACDNCPSVATPWVVPAGDGDCDGWTDADEGPIGTDAGNRCGTEWPANLNNTAAASINKIDIYDVNALAPPVFFSGTGDPNYSVRKDIARSPPSTSGKIDIFDVNRMAPPVFFATCTP